MAFLSTGLSSSLFRGEFKKGRLIFSLLSIHLITLPPRFPSRTAPPYLLLPSRVLQVNHAGSDDDEDSTNLNFEIAAMDFRPLMVQTGYTKHLKFTQKEMKISENAATIQKSKSTHGKMQHALLALPAKPEQRISPKVSKIKQSLPGNGLTLPLSVSLSLRRPCSLKSDPPVQTSSHHNVGLILQKKWTFLDTSTTPSNFKHHIRAHITWWLLTTHIWTTEIEVFCMLFGSRLSEIRKDISQTTYRIIPFRFPEFNSESSPYTTRFIQCRGKFDIIPQQLEIWGTSWMKQTVPC